MALRLFLRGALAVAIIGAGIVVGEQLRVARAQLATGQAASGDSARASATPTPAPTATPVPKTLLTSPAPPPTPTTATPTVVPTPIATPFTGRLSTVIGTVTMGGNPVRGARVMVYPSDPSNHGPTPVPPESALATTDARGAYQVALQPGTYRVGAFRDYTNPVRDFGDGYTWVTWYGDGFVIGLGKDLVVSGSSTVADIALLRSVKVAGSVVGRDGVGVPNAQLSLSRYIGGIQFPFGGGRSDAAGRFSLSIVAMPVTLLVQASGRNAAAWSSVDLDLRGDRTDIIATIDRGNVVSGTLRDAAGRQLADMNFGVVSAGGLLSCASCSGRTDGAGHFAVTLPSTTIRFSNWPQDGELALLSNDYVISGDLTLDAIMQKP
jgi:hypothetical protein